MYNIRVVSQKVATPYEIHCFWSNVTFKGCRPGVKQNGRILEFLSDIKPTMMELELETNKFSIRSITEVESTYNFQENDVVVMSGKISYSFHKKVENKSKYFCPIDYRGEIIKHMRDDFCKVMTTKLGIDVFRSLSNKQINITKLDSHDGKVWLNDCFNLDIEGVVINPSVTNSLEFLPVGRRNSYGFGMISTI